jgi:hypothetical protein
MKLKKMHTRRRFAINRHFLGEGVEKEPAFGQKVCASDSDAAAVSRSVIHSNVVLKAFN